MRFKATPFTHPEYEALRKQSEFWANVWGLGYVFFVVFLAIACAAPIIVTVVVLIARIRYAVACGTSEEGCW